MSDQPTDIVFSALQQMQANGVRLRASLDTMEHLRKTAHTPAPTAGPTALQTHAIPTQTPQSNPTAIGQRTQPKFISRTTEPSSRMELTADVTSNSGENARKLAALRGPVLACTKCPHLVQSREQVVFGVGNPEAELMFVGEAPGADEDLVGEPFVGRAGQLLTKIIEAMNFRRQDVYIANILKCRPNTPPGESGNRKPTPAEMNVCKPYLLQQIEIIQPKILVALGATAVEGLLGLEKAGITKMRGTWKEFHGIPMMPTFHPSFLLRPTGDQMANKRLVWEDMLAVLEKLGHEITAKQRGYFLAK
jgi:DNA polymerase